MRFRCPFCFYTVSADDSLRGYQLNCPGCSRQLYVPPSRFQDGCVIGDFVIRSKIGSGAVGTVYLATQLSLERQVALKVLLPEFSTRTGIRDFLQEARAAAAVNHINRIPSVAIGEEDGICYMAMPYISGGSVGNFASVSPSPPRLPQVLMLFSVPSIVPGLALFTMVAPSPSKRYQSNVSACTVNAASASNAAAVRP